MERLRQKFSQITSMRVKKKIKDMQNELQNIIDAYNKTAPLYKRVFKLKVRETEFEKNTTKKIKRF